MPSKVAAESETDGPKKPKFATPEALAAARAITPNLTWDDLVRIAHKPKRSGWVLWRVSGAVEQVLPTSHKDKLLVRAWKSSCSHVISRRTDDSDYNCVELDPVTKMPLLPFAP